jgi:peptidyl-prolyl cis-trans isomerase C
MTLHMPRSSFDILPAPRRRFGQRVAIAASLIVCATAIVACGQNTNSGSAQNSAAGASTVSAAESTDGGTVVAKVNGTEIRQGDLNIAAEDLGANLPPMSEDSKRDYLIKYVSDIMLAAKAAEAKNVADSADFKQRLAFARNKMLMESLLLSTGKAAVSDDELHRVYQEASKQMGQEEEVRARHILVETEDEANEIVSALKNGADFAELAKQKSKDPGASEGGDLGYFTKDQMVPEFSEVAFKMSPGQLSNPIKTQFGWHVIRLEDKRIRQAPPFEEVKGQIENYVVRKAQADLITKLRSDAKVERLDAKPAEQKPAQPK